MVDIDKHTEAIKYLLDFKTEPVTIQEYLTNPYYLGDIFGTDQQLFPMLREDIYNFFPNNILNKSNILVLSGATGVGKTTVSSIVENYIAYKFSCLKDPYKALAHNRFNTTYKMKHVHINQQKAEEKQIKPQEKLYNESPYWRDYRKKSGFKYPFNLDLEATTKLSHALSDETIVAHITEVNFYKPEYIENMVSGMISRINNRFQLGALVFPLVILDSSNLYANSYLDDFVENSVYKDMIYKTQHNNWEVRRFLGVFDGVGTFSVFCGTGDDEPKIIKETDDISKLDQDRILNDIPNIPEYRLMAEQDIEKFLQDYAGISVITGSKFIKSSELIDSNLILESHFNKEIIVDQFDDVQISECIDFKKLLDLLPQDKPIHIAMDCGVSNDNTGIAIGYAESYKEKRISETEYEPEITIKVPIVLRINRKDGQETSLDKISLFIASIISKKTVLSFTTDSYQSTHIRQQVRKYGVEDSSMLSVDRDDKAYQELKRKLYRNEIQIANHPILKLELKELSYSNKKVDHLYTGSKIPNTQSNDGRISGLGSKDMADAVASVCYKIVSYGKDNFINVDIDKKVNDFNNLLDSLSRNKLNIGNRNIGGGIKLY